jgi:hypothetical protein
MAEEPFEGLTAAFNARDAERVLAYYSDDVVFDVTEAAEGIYRGKDEDRRFLERFWEAMDWGYETERLAAVRIGDSVATLNTAAGSGAISGVPFAGTVVFSYKVTPDGLIAQQKYHRSLDTLSDDLREALRNQQPARGE